MKILAILMLAASPAAAEGMWMQSMAGGNCPMGGHFATALYGLLAALGYWVLHHAAKDGARYVKRAGQAVAWTLIVTGLLGLLCGAAAHVKSNLNCATGCDVAEWEGEYGEGMPEEGGEQTIKVQVIKGGGK